MKKYLQILTVCFIALMTIEMTAQEGFNPTAKGSFLINGTVNVFNTTRKVNDDKADAFTIEVAPKAGYFVIENLAVGLELNIFSNSETQEDDIFGDIETKNTGFGIGPFARYYLDSGFFGEALVGLGSQKTTLESGSGDAELKSSVFGFRIGAGYAFFLGDHVAIEPTVNYSWEDINPKDAPSGYKETLSSLFLAVGISAYF